MNKYKMFNLLMFFIMIMLSGCLNDSKKSVDEEINSENTLKTMVTQKSEVNKTIKSKMTTTQMTTTKKKVTSKKTTTNNDTPKVAANILCWNKEYILEKVEDNMTVNEVLNKLLVEMLNDLGTENSMRSFVVTEYKDLKYYYELYLNEKYDSNAWTVTGEIDVRFTGYISPIGKGENVPNDDYCTVSIGERLLIKENNRYVLKSFY